MRRLLESLLGCGSGDLAADHLLASFTPLCMVDVIDSMIFSLCLAHCARTRRWMPRVMAGTDHRSASSD